MPDSAASPTVDTFDPVRQRGETSVTHHRYEFRVAGKLSDLARSAFDGMSVVEVPVETVIHGPLDDPAELHRVLARIQAMGLHVVSLKQVATGRCKCAEVSPPPPARHSP
jgi:hypothetical protein